MCVYVFTGGSVVRPCVCVSDANKKTSTSNMQAMGILTGKTQ